MDNLHKAFRIVFEMSTSSKSISSIQMGKRFDLRQGTAWYFMQKVRKSMKSSEKHPLASLVHVDEEKKAVIAVELTTDKKIKRAYVKSFEDYSSKSLAKIFDTHISEHTAVVTDKWRGYEPLKKIYNIEQKLSNNGANFNELHIVIIQLKSWIRTIPTHISKFHIQSYFDEFCYRINRSQAKHSIFHKTIERMVIHKPIIYHKKYKTDNKCIA